MSATGDQSNNINNNSVVQSPNHAPRRKSLTEKVEEGQIDSVDTEARWLAYGARLRTAIRASTRYLAYSSDVGEAFRPIVPPAIVRAAYGISWAYVGLDVGYEGYKSHKAGNVSHKFSSTGYPGAK
jgi:fission process protein 1